MTGTVVDELVTILGLQADPGAEKTASSWGRMIGGITGFALKAGAALAGVATAVNAYAINQAAAIDETGKFADSIGLNFEKLQELEYAAKQTGGSVDELRADLQKLSKMPGGGDAADKLLRIADRLQHMNKRQQQNFADMVGISPATLRTLQQGRGNIEALAKRARDLGVVMNEVAKERAAKFRASFLDLQDVVQGVGKEISVGLLPNITKTVDAFTRWIGTNRTWISLGIQQIVKGVGDGFAMVGRWVTAAWKAVEKFTGPLGDLVKDLDISQPIMLAVAAALTALTAAFIAANAPVILLTAAIAAIILVIDDLYAYFNGGDSIVGRWVEAFTTKFPNITAAIKAVYDFIVKGLSDAMKASEQMFDDLVKSFKAAFDLIMGFIGAIVDTIENLLGDVPNPFEPLVKWFSEIGGKLLDMATNLAKNIGEKIANGIKAVGTGIVDFVTGGPETPQYAPGEGPSIMDGYDPKRTPQAPAANVPPALLVAPQTSNNNFNVTQNINGAGDPRAVGQESVNRMGLGGSLQRMQPGGYAPTVK